MKFHYPLFIFLSPWVAAPLALGASYFSARWANRTAYAGLALGFYFDLKCVPALLTGGNWHYELGGWAPPWGVELVLTPFTCLFCALLLILSICVLFYMGYSFPGGPKGKNRFFPPVLCAFLAAQLAVVLIRDGFTLYLFLEISLIFAAALLALSGEKTWLDSFYLLLGGSAGASLLLLGVLFLYAATGAVHLDDILAQLFASKISDIALTSGILFTASFSFYFCFPAPFFFTRLLRQAPPFFTGLFSAAAVRGAAYLLFVLLFFTIKVPGLTQPLWLEAAEYLLAYFFLAGFAAAAKQKDFRQVLGYLSFAQLAYFFLGMILGNKSGLTGALMELLNQVPVTAGLFFIAGTLKEGPGPYPLSRMAGLARHRPWTGICLVVFSASILGIPPTAGFFGKWYLIQGALENKDWFVLTAILSALLFNLFYFGKFALFLYEHQAPSPAHGPLSVYRRAPFFLMAALVLFLGILHQDVIRGFIEPALPKAFLNVQMPNVPFLGQQVE
jgi:multicomponent Na+:H+ antiporter subunit D